MRNLYKKSKLGTKYTYIITSTPVPVLLFIALGVFLFIIMTISIRIDIISTFHGRFDSVRSVFIIGTVEELRPDTVYAYSNRNEFVASVKIDGIEVASGNTILHISPRSLALTRSFPIDINIDVPKGKESLFHRLVIRAGKNYE